MHDINDLFGIVILFCAYRCTRVPILENKQEFYIIIYNVTMLYYTRLQDVLSAHCKNK